MMGILHGVLIINAVCCTLPLSGAKFLGEGAPFRSSNLLRDYGDDSKNL